MTHVPYPATFRVFRKDCSCAQTRGCEHLPRIVRRYCVKIAVRRGIIAEARNRSRIQREEMSRLAPFFFCSYSQLPVPYYVWVKIKPPGYGPQVLVHVSTYQGCILGLPYSLFFGVSTHLGSDSPRSPTENHPDSAFGPSTATNLGGCGVADSSPRRGLLQRNSELGMSLFLGDTSPFPGILLSRKPPETQGKQPVFGKNDG